MHTLQTFLIIILTSFVWLTFIQGLALAGDGTIYDKDWRVKERIKDGTIYDRDWKVKGCIGEGKIYDRNWNMEEWSINQQE